MPRGARRSLRLEDALVLTLAAHPDLSDQAAESEQAEGRIEQAGRRPLTTASLELEDAFGSDPFAGVDASQTTFSVSRPLELGSKRDRRLAVAREEHRLLERIHEVERVEILRSTARAFLRVVRAQEELRFADELKRMQEELHLARLEQIRVGRVPEAEEDRSLAAVALAEVQRTHARAELEIARRELALHVGLSEAEIGEVVHDPAIPDAMPPLAELEERLERNRALGQAEASLLLAEAALEREEANSIPDLELSLGVRRIEESDDHAFVMGVSIPVTLGRHNHGDLRAARAARIAAIERRAAVHRRLRTQLHAGYELLRSTLEEVRTLESEVLPAAERSYATSESGFRLGSIGYLELREAQDTLLSARRQLANARIGFCEAWADVRAITDDFDLGSQR